MASAIVPADKFRDILICKICMENMDEPKSLPCQHSFCLGCLETMVNSNIRTRFVTCPICREESMLPRGGVKELRSSFIMNTLLDIAKEESISCDLCGDQLNHGRTVCIECAQGFCHRCAQMHKSTRGTESHKMVDLTGDYIHDILSVVEMMNHHSLGRHCHIHPREPLKFLCKADNTIICHDCHVTAHNGHKCIEIKTAAQTYLQKIQNQISPWKQMTSHIQNALQTAESQRKSIIGHTQAIKEQIHQDRESILKALNKHFDDLINTIDKQEIKQTEPKDIELNNLELSRAIAESMLTQLNGITENTDPIDIVALGIELTESEPPIVKPVKFAQQCQISYRPCEITRDVIKLGNVSISEKKDHEAGSVHTRPRRPPSTYMGTATGTRKIKYPAPKRPPRIIDNAKSPSIQAAGIKSTNNPSESNDKRSMNPLPQGKPDARIYPNIPYHQDDTKYDKLSSLKDTTSKGGYKTLPRDPLEPTAPPINEYTTSGDRPVVPARTYIKYSNTHDKEYYGNLI